MSFSNKFLNRMFRRIGNVVWDITTNGVGVQTENGIISFTQTPGADGAVIFGTSVNPLDGMGVTLPAFATQKAIADIEVGDLVVGDNAILGWVTGKTEAALKLLDHNGNNKMYSPPKVAIMNTSGVLVVQSLIGLTGSADGASNFANSMLPLLLMGGGSDSKLEKLLPFLLMQSAIPAAAGAAPAANPMAAMLPLLLLKDGGLGGLTGGKKDGIDPMMLLAMSGGLGGGSGGMNPMVMMALLGGDLGGSTEAPKPLRMGPPPLQRV